MAKPPYKPDLPSKADILTFIEQQDGEISRRDIARAFNIKGADRTALRQTLREMREEGLIAKQRGKKVSEAGGLPNVAVLDVSQDEEGELIGTPVKWDDDNGVRPTVLIKIDKRNKQTNALPGVGDRVLARITKNFDNDPHYAYTARIMRRLEKRAERVLGMFSKTEHGGRISLIDKKARYELDVMPEDTAGAKDHELVELEVLPRGRMGLRRARILKRLAPLNDARNISLIAIHEHNIPDAFPQSVMDEARAAKPVTTPKGRTDLRDLPLITIDPADARDHDDAVCAMPDDDPDNEGGHIIWVAIADVSHYVRPGSALDKEALMRGNSSYFPDRVVPMLPDSLSGDLCSLHEGVDRPCLAVRIVFDKKGKKLGHKFVRGLMRSAASLTYEQAQAGVEGRPDDQTGPLVDPVLKPLWSAWNATRKERTKRSPLDLDLPEHRVRLGDDGKVSAVTLRDRLDAHRLIEDCMILANVAAAEELEGKGMACLYRVHEEPSDEKLATLRDYLNSLDLSITPGPMRTPERLNGLLKQIKDTPNELVVPEVILRSQKQAIYSPENLGHFGLNLRRYAHFTSPIRRYADLIVHRGLITACKLGEGGLSADDMERLDRTASEISDTERRSMKAERSTTDRYLAHYMQDHTGATFAGRIAGVANAGLFVKLDGLGADGLIPMRRLPNDYYDYREQHFALVGERSKIVYGLGDRVEVRLLEATPVRGGLLFELEDHQPTRTINQLRGGKQANRRGGPRSGRGAPKGGNSGGNGGGNGRGRPPKRKKPSKR